MRATCPGRPWPRLVLACALALGAAHGGPSGADVHDAPPIRIVVGIDDAFPPHQWVDERGEPRGFDVDLVRALARAEGLELEIRGGPWHEIRDQLERGEIDLAPSMVRTQERERLLDFSIPMGHVAHTIFVRKDDPIEDLAGAVVALEQGTIADDRLLERVPSAKPLRTDTPLEALQAVAEGRADAAILMDTQGLYFIREYDLTGIRSIGEPVSQLLYRFAVPHDRHELLARLNDGLHKLRESGAYDALYDEWLGVLRPTGPLESPAGRALLVVTGSIALLLLAALLWSRTLRRQVETRTRALRASESEARRLEARLHQAQKMEALGRLAGGVAHDFNNVLTTIIGNASLAIDAVEPETPLARLLAAIRRAGRSGADLSRQLLSFARGGAGQPRDVSWNQVVADAQDMLQRLIGSRIRLHFEAREDLWPVRLDPGQALQVVMNLVVNARDAIPGSGHVTIEVANVPDDDGDRVCLCVRDDGDGMDAETRQHIFEPFYTTRAARRGTGLGLSTVFGIVEGCGGRVEVESEPGSGSAFRVWLPRAPEPHAAAARSSPTSGEPRSALVVEDDAGVRELACALLRSLGLEVTEAPDGESALRQVREKGSPALLLTDLDLPGFSGAELARRVLAEFPQTRLLFLSGYSDDLGLPPGARIAWLPKPFDSEALSEALASLEAPG